jgi:hypothetical protein
VLRCLAMSSKKLNSVVFVSVLKLSVVGVSDAAPSNVLKKLNCVVSVSVLKQSVVGLSDAAPSNVRNTNSTVGFL